MKREITSNDVEVFGVVRFGDYVVLDFGDTFGKDNRFAVANDPDQPVNSPGRIFCRPGTLSGAMKVAAREALREPDVFHIKNDNNPLYQWVILPGWSGSND